VTLGIAEVAFLRHPDGEVEDTRALRGEIVAAIRRWRPAALFTHDPDHPYPPYTTHRDHRVVEPLPVGTAKSRLGELLERVRTARTNVRAPALTAVQAAPERVHQSSLAAMS